MSYLNLNHHHAALRPRQQPPLLENDWIDWMVVLLVIGFSNCKLSIQSRWRESDLWVSMRNKKVLTFVTNYPGSVYVVVAALRAEDLPADSERKSERNYKSNKFQKIDFFAEFLPAAALRLGLIEV